MVIIHFIEIVIFYTFENEFYSVNIHYSNRYASRRRSIFMVV